MFKVKMYYDFHSLKGFSRDVSVYAIESSLSEY